MEWAVGTTGLDLSQCLKITGGVTTVMAVLIKNRSATAPPVWRGIKPPCNREKVDWRPCGDPVAVLLR